MLHACVQKFDMTGTEVNFLGTKQGLSLLRKSLTTLSPVLNADSDGTVDTGTDRTSRAMRARTGYVAEFYFHHPKISKSSVLGTIFSARYALSSLED